MDEKLLKFKEKMDEDENFKKLFASAYNLDEIVDIARENGYDLDMDEIMDDAELSDQFLETVAGGKKSVEDDTYLHRLVGDHNLVFEAGSKEAAEAYAQLVVGKLHEKGIYGKH